ncbi:MAG: SGNH/GDSL hydrolase family protein [Phycisphaera sp.]|nr:SGNH/GDSL hydrolase family protein [Phycisphaera sp.]
MEFYTPERDNRRLDASNATGPDACLPSLFIIGDSISQGYTPIVREMLRGRCNVERPRANCGDTRLGLERLDEWLDGRRWDVIHFNWGLHDLCHRHPDSKVYGNRDKIRGTISVPIEEYRTNLETLVGRMKPSAKRLIWASTTVVPPGEAGRFEGDERRYNDVARRIMQAHNIPINDLHALSSTFTPDLFTQPGDVHFTEEGYRLLAQQVARFTHAPPT